MAKFQKCKPPGPYGGSVISLFPIQFCFATFGELEQLRVIVNLNWNGGKIQKKINCHQPLFLGILAMAKKHGDHRHNDTDVLHDPQKKPLLQCNYAFVRGIFFRLGNYNSFLKPYFFAIPVFSISEGHLGPENFNHICSLNGFDHLFSGSHQ